MFCDLDLIDWSVANLGCIAACCKFLRDSLLLNLYIRVCVFLQFLYLCSCVFVFGFNLDLLDYSTANHAALYSPCKSFLMQWKFSTYLYLFLVLYLCMFSCVVLYLCICVFVVLYLCICSFNELQIWCELQVAVCNPLQILSAAKSFNLLGLPLCNEVISSTI